MTISIKNQKPEKSIPKKFKVTYSSLVSLFGEGWGEDFLKVCSLRYLVTK